jgi:hypothetical protein
LVDASAILSNVRFRRFSKVWSGTEWQVPSAQQGRLTLRPQRRKNGSPGADVAITTDTTGKVKSRTRRSSAS